MSITATELIDTVFQMSPPILSIETLEFDYLCLRSIHLGCEFMSICKQALDQLEQVTSKLSLKLLNPNFAEIKLRTSTLLDKFPLGISKIKLGDIQYNSNMGHRHLIPISSLPDDILREATKNRLVSRPQIFNTKYSMIYCDKYRSANYIYVDDISSGEYHDLRMAVRTKDISHITDPKFIAKLYSMFADVTVRT